MMQAMAWKKRSCRSRSIVVVMFGAFLCSMSLLRSSVLFVAPQQSDRRHRHIDSVTSQSGMLLLACRKISGSGSGSGSGSTLVGATEFPSILATLPPVRGDVAAYYKVTLVTPDGEKTFECPEDASFTDQAKKELGLELPIMCGTGECKSCAGQVVTGTINQKDQKILSEEQVTAGYCLTCISRPTSDVTIATHKAGDVGVKAPDNNKIYKVTVVTPDDGEKVFDCPGNIPIAIQILEKHDVTLGPACGGYCTKCTGWVETVDIPNINQDEQAMLEDSQVKDGYCLLCVTFPKSDMKIFSGMESDMKR